MATTPTAAPTVHPSKSGVALGIATFFKGAVCVMGNFFRLVVVDARPAAAVVIIEEEMIDAVTGVVVDVVEEVVGGAVDTT
jgi:hypothetical protein